MKDEIREKPLMKKTKVLYTIIVLFLMVVTIVPLAAMGKVQVSSEQIFEFGQWVLTALLGTHAFQRGSGYIAQAIGNRRVESDATEPVGARAEEEEE